MIWAVISCMVFSNLDWSASQLSSVVSETEVSVELEAMWSWWKDESEIGHCLLYGASWVADGVEESVGKWAMEAGECGGSCENDSQVLPISEEEVSGADIASALLLVGSEVMMEEPL